MSPEMVLKSVGLGCVGTDTKMLCGEMDKASGACLYVKAEKRKLGGYRDALSVTTRFTACLFLFKATIYDI